MNLDLGIIWDRLTRIIIFLLFVAGLLAVAIWYFPLIRQNERLRQRILQFDARIQQQEQTEKQLRASIEELRHDPKAVARLARERLGYSKPGETVVRFEAPSGSTPNR
jgi:cell division protein FtsB